jgi:hypothetical protein
MMIVNGASQPDVAVWTSTVAVDAYTDYYFWSWVAASFDRSPTVLGFDINGTPIGTDFTVEIPSTDPANPPLGTWQLFYAHWNSGATTTANVSIVNHNIAYGGNDFALDSIGLDRVRPTGGTDTTVDDPILGEPVRSLEQTIPEPSTLVLLAAGLLATLVGSPRRRRGAARR